MTSTTMTTITQSLCTSFDIPRQRNEEEKGRPLQAISPATIGFPIVLFVLERRSQRTCLEPSLLNGAPIIQSALRRNLASDRFALFAYMRGALLCRRLDQQAFFTKRGTMSVLVNVTVYVVGNRLCSPTMRSRFRGTVLLPLLPCT